MIYYFTEFYTATVSQSDYSKAGICISSIFETSNKLLPFEISHFFFQSYFFLVRHLSQPCLIFEIWQAWDKPQNFQLKAGLDFQFLWPKSATDPITNLIIGHWNWPSVYTQKCSSSTPQYYIKHIRCLCRNNIQKRIQIYHKIQTKKNW